MRNNRFSGPWDPWRAKRRTIIIAVFIAGSMLGASSVQLKDQLTLSVAHSSFDKISRCLSMGP
jgi:hypothetical protein